MLPTLRTSAGRIMHVAIDTFDWIGAQAVGMKGAFVDWGRPAGGRTSRISLSTT